MPYFIHGKQLGITNTAKYLGITICDNLSWNTHISNHHQKSQQHYRFS